MMPHGYGGDGLLVILLVICIAPFILPVVGAAVARWYACYTVGQSVGIAALVFVATCLLLFLASAVRQWLMS